MQKYKVQVMTHPVKQNLDTNLIYGSDMTKLWVCGVTEEVKNVKRLKRLSNDTLTKD